MALAWYLFYTAAATTTREHVCAFPCGEDMDTRGLTALHGQSPYDVPVSTTPNAALSTSIVVTRRTCLSEFRSPKCPCLHTSKYLDTCAQWWGQSLKTHGQQLLKTRGVLYRTEKTPQYKVHRSYAFLRFPPLYWLRCRYRGDRLMELGLSRIDLNIELCKQTPPRSLTTTTQKHFSTTTPTALINSQPLYHPSKCPTIRA